MQPNLGSKTVVARGIWRWECVRVAMGWSVGVGRGKVVGLGIFGGASGGPVGGTPGGAGGIGDAGLENRCMSTPGSLGLVMDM